MKIINSVLPFKGFHAMAIWPFIFIRKDYHKKNHNTTRYEIMLNHEKIHHRQQIECLIIPFYIIYIGHWCINLLRFRGKPYFSYENICFEKEAYKNEENHGYLENRKPYATFKKEEINLLTNNDTSPITSIQKYLISLGILKKYR